MAKPIYHFGNLPELLKSTINRNAFKYEKSVEALPNAIKGAALGRTGLRQLFSGTNEKVKLVLGELFDGLQKAIDHRVAQLQKAEPSPSKPLEKPIPWSEESPRLKAFYAYLQSGQQGIFNFCDAIVKSADASIQGIATTPGLSPQDIQAQQM